MKDFIEELIIALEQNFPCSGNEALATSCIEATGISDHSELLHDLVVAFDESSWEEVFEAARRQGVDNARLEKLQALVEDRRAEYRRGQQGIDDYIYE